MVICSTVLEEGCAISSGLVDQHRDLRLRVSFRFSFSFGVRQGLFPALLFILKAQCVTYKSQAISVFRVGT